MTKPTLMLRERTQNVALETTHCQSCGFNHWSNIGRLTCERCDQDKMPVLNYASATVSRKR